jgi:hypothetical protein
MSLAANSTAFFFSSVNTGQPLLEAGYAIVGHLSSSSLIPSLSVSGIGQP